MRGGQNRARRITGGRWPFQARSALRERLAVLPLRGREAAAYAARTAGIVIVEINRSI